MAENCRQRYYNDISIYQIGQYILSDCADITFLNTGTSNVNVNGIILLPNQSLVFSANQDEIDTTKYSMFFVGAGAQSCTVIRKYYVD
jgi:hypothetical protein